MESRLVIGIASRCAGNAGRNYSFRLFAVGMAVLGMTGCGAKPQAVVASPANGDTLAPGVVHRAIALPNGTGVDVVDVDLSRARVRIDVATDGVGLAGGMIGGRAHTPHEWLDRLHALAAANGGYFGREDAQGRKEFVGLLAQKGRVRHAAPPLMGHGSAGAGAGRYVRSVFGVTAGGVPTIAWAATVEGRPLSLRAYASPTEQGAGQAWHAWSAVGCGPRLVSRGRVRVTDSEERLVSPGADARTFVAYDSVGGKPRHFVLGMASGMEYRDVAAFVMRYFPRYDGTQASAAMCVDGGASTQLSYRLPNGRVQSPRETGVSVPDAIVIVPRP